MNQAWQSGNVCWMGCMPKSLHAETYLFFLMTPPPVWHQDMIRSMFDSHLSVYHYNNIELLLVQSRSVFLLQVWSFKLELHLF